MAATGLIIIDKQTSEKDVEDFISSHSNIIICPLLSDRSILDDALRVLERQGCEHVLVDTAKKIYAKSIDINSALLKWSYEVGEIKLSEEGNLKQFFSIDDYSNYYSTLISEKNPMKSGLFLEAIQLNVIIDVAKEYEVDSLYIDLSSSSLGESIKLKLCEHAIVDKSEHSIKEKILNQDNVAGVIAKGLGFFVRLCYWSLLANIMCNKKYIDQIDHIIITYFPYVKSLKTNKFENLYFSPLQNMLEEKSIKPFWVLMFVFVNNIGYRQAIELRRRYQENGERLVMLEEFYSVSTIIKIILTYLRIVFRYRSVRGHILASQAHKIINIDNTRIIEKMCDISFLGINAISGLAYYYGYKEVAKKLGHAKTLTYLMEMQAWEKAMLCAFKNDAPEVHTIGYQHTSIGRNYYFYFSDSSEVDFYEYKFGNPLPRTFAVCGNLQKKILDSCPYQNIKVFPAIRKHDLKAAYENQYYKKNDRVAFLGSYDKTETKAALQLIVAALRQNDADWGVVAFKGHPSCPLEPILNIIPGYDEVKANIEIVTGSVDDILKKCSVVICGSSSVSIDAVMFGCNVIVPLVSNSMNISPLLDYEMFCVKVSNARELSEAISELIVGKSAEAQRDAINFVRDYWQYDPELKLWKEAMQLEAYA